MSEPQTEVATEVAAVVAPAADAPAPAAAAPDDAAAPAPAADAADPKQEELTEKDLLGSATLVTFPDRALGVSIEADEEGPVYVASVKTFSAARGRVRAGDVVALVDGVAAASERRGGLGGLRPGPQGGPAAPVVAFGRPPKEPATTATAARKTRPRAKRARETMSTTTTSPTRSSRPRYRLRDATRAPRPSEDSRRPSRPSRRARSTGASSCLMTWRPEMPL